MPSTRTNDPLGRLHPSLSPEPPKKKSSTAESNLADPRRLALGAASSHREPSFAQLAIRHAIHYSNLVRRSAPAVDLVLRRKRFLQQRRKQLESLSTGRPDLHQRQGNFQDLLQAKAIHPQEAAEDRRLHRGEPSPISTHARHPLASIVFQSFVFVFQRGLTKCTNEDGVKQN